MTGPELTVSVDGTVHRFRPGEPVVAGRATDCPIVLTDPRVSRRHLEVTFDDGWHLSDLGTVNGTWRGSERVTCLRLDSSTAVRLGDPREGPLIELTPSAAAGEPADLAPPIPLRDALTIGRDTGNDLVLEDLLVSRRHARVFKAGNGFRVEDLGSANATFVNGSAIGTAPLHEGDELSVGRTRLVLAGRGLRRVAERAESGLEVEGAWYGLPSGRSLVANVSLRLSGPSLLAVIGPSGAGKSTLLRLLSGELAPARGRIRYQDRDVHTGDDVRARIGVIPQDAVVHRRLTARAALSYAAELRLPPDITVAERDRRVGEIMTELGLAEHGGTRVDRLSGGQLRRLSIGFELITRPSLLLVDEPTAGLDPGLVRHVMSLMRHLADSGLQVVVTTHDLDHLDLFDTVLVLAPGGREVYLGPPDGIERRFGTRNWADIFERLSAVPEHTTDQPPPAPQRPTRYGRADQARARHQAKILIRRQLSLLAADRPYAAFLAGLPVILAALALAVPGQDGLRAPAAPSTEAMRLLVVLIIGAAFMGTAAPIRDVVAERPIYRHERAAGLLPDAYLAAKLTVFAGITAAQSALLVALVRLIRPGPSDAVLIGSPTLEIGAAVAATAIACTAAGLAISALVATVEQTTPPLVVSVMAQLVLCGGLIPVTGRFPLAQLAMLTPARWGYALAAATVDLRTVSAGAPQDALWSHSPLVWLAGIVALAILTAALTALTARLLRRR